jgi:hypothetical protein
MAAVSVLGCYRAHIQTSSSYFFAKVISLRKAVYNAEMGGLLLLLPAVTGATNGDPQILASCLTVMRI